MYRPQRHIYSESILGLSKIVTIYLISTEHRRELAVDNWSNNVWLVIDSNPSRLEVAWTCRPRIDPNNTYISSPFWVSLKLWLSTWFWLNVDWSSRSIFGWTMFDLLSTHNRHIFRVDFGSLSCSCVAVTLADEVTRLHLYKVVSLNFYSLPLCSC